MIVLVNIYIFIYAELRRILLRNNKRMAALLALATARKDLTFPAINA